MSSIRSLTATYTKPPLRDPFVLSIRSATHANVIRWQLELSNGEVYLGESVPVQYVTGETPDTVLASLESFRHLLIGRSLEAGIEELMEPLDRAHPSDHAARAGVEMALYQAIAGSEGKTLQELFGGRRLRIETDLTISRIPNAVDVAKRALASGFRIFKVKIGGGELAEDLDRLVALRACSPEAIFRLDANQAFDADEALRRVDAILEAGVPVELVEQPVPKEDLAALSEVARLSPVPVIADEACRSVEDARRIVETTPVHGVNVKLMKTGLRGAQEIMLLTQAAGKRLMIGCMLESEVGMSASVALASGSGAFDYNDLDGHLLLDLQEPIRLFEAEGPWLRAL